MQKKINHSADKKSFVQDRSKKSAGNKEKRQSFSADEGRPAKKNSHKKEWDRRDKQPVSDDTERKTRSPRDNDYPSAGKRIFTRDKRDDLPNNRTKPRAGGGSDYRGSDRSTFKDNDRPYRKPQKESDRPVKKFNGRESSFRNDDSKPRPRNNYSRPFDRERQLPDDDDRGYYNKKGKRDVEPKDEYPMPLNKYIAHSGECSRRDAAELVKQGKVKVNGELVLEPGRKVNAEDKITLSGKKLTPQRGKVYILLNKPRGYITTNEDPRGRRTVMDLVSKSGTDRLFSVGRLDRNTTGLLLMTNDGDLAQKLSHPSYEVKKVYHVTLDKPLSKADFDKIQEGVTLEDGIAKVDDLAYLENKNELGLEIHSGKNRIVRRIFESLGYVVDRLDRVMYAGLTKKNLPRGKWRKLEEKEIILLKHFKS